VDYTLDNLKTAMQTSLFEISKIKIENYAYEDILSDTIYKMDSTKTHFVNNLP